MILNEKGRSLSATIIITREIYKRFEQIFHSTLIIVYSYASTDFSLNEYEARE